MNIGRERSSSYIDLMLATDRVWFAPFFVSTPMTCSGELPCVTSIVESSRS